MPGTRRADQPAEFADAVTQVLAGTAHVDAAGGRRYVCEYYGWQASLATFDRLFKVEAPAALPELPAVELGHS